MTEANNSGSFTNRETRGSAAGTRISEPAHAPEPTTTRWFAFRLLPVAAGLALVVFLLAPEARTFRFVAGALLVYGVLVVAEKVASKAPVLSIRVRPQIVLLCTSLCLGLCLAEAIIRLFFHQLLPDWNRIGAGGQVIGYDHDPLLGWAPVPGRQNDLGRINGIQHYKAINNSKGLRDSEPALDARPGLLVLGDSCVWGCDVSAEERFTEKLRARHPEWQVYNFGVVGYGTDQEYLLLKRHMVDYHPQVVFLVICTQNDEHDNCSNGGGLVVYKPYFTTGPKGLQLHGVPVPLSDRLFCLHHPFLSKVHLTRMVMRAWGRLRSPPPPSYDKAITRALIQELRNYVRYHHAVFCVGLTQGYPEMERFLKSCAIPYVSLSTDSDLTYDSIHWNEKGHTFVADRIEEFLARENMMQARHIPIIW